MRSVLPKYTLHLLAEAFAASHVRGADGFPLNLYCLLLPKALEEPSHRSQSLNENIRTFYQHIEEETKTGKTWFFFFGASVPSESALRSRVFYCLVLYQEQDFVNDLKSFSITEVYFVSIGY